MHIFRMIYEDNKTLDVRAEHFTHSDHGAYLFWTIPQERANYVNYSARILDKGVQAVIRLDMLVETISSHSYFPEVLIGNDSNVDLIRDAIFSEDQRTPFSLQERKLISSAISEIAEEIKKTYRPKDESLADIEEKLDYLSRKVNDLTKFDWKRLLVSTMIGISIDLGFGTLIPSSLLELFKKAGSNLKCTTHT